MSFRKPSLSDQVKQLRESFSMLSIGRAQEQVARLNGYPSWNAARAAEKAAKSTSTAAQSPCGDTFVVTVYPAMHHHRHGSDVFLFAQNPSEEEVAEEINSVSSYEPEEGESIEVLNGVELKVPGATAALPGVAEINMTDFLEYDSPESIREWRWVMLQASFAHKDNGTGPGVWEFMVRADKLKALMNEGGGQVPSLLLKAIDKALAKNPTWVLFHQG